MRCKPDKAKSLELDCTTREQSDSGVEPRSETSIEHGASLVCRARRESRSTTRPSIATRSVSVLLDDTILQNHDFSFPIVLVWPMRSVSQSRWRFIVGPWAYGNARLAGSHPPGSVRARALVANMAASGAGALRRTVTESTDSRRLVVTVAKATGLANVRNVLLTV